MLCRRVLTAVILAALTNGNASAQQAKHVITFWSSAEAAIRDVGNAQAFAGLRSVFLLLQPEDGATQDEVFTRAGFTPQGSPNVARGQRWQRVDSAGRLEVSMLVDGRAIRANLSFSPSSQEQIAPPILEQLLRMATKVEQSATFAAALELVQEEQPPFHGDNCRIVDERTIAFAGTLRREAFVLSCTK